MSEEAQEYKLTLTELKSNNKTQINLLTILADDYKKNAAEIVDVIEAHLHTVSPPMKLLTMYVMDSILKNVKEQYIELFSKKIISMFSHVFQHGDEKIRSALYKLRVTWSGLHVFMPSKLYQIDMRVHSLDSAWPIANPQTGRALKDDPAVTAPRPQKPQVASASSSSSSTSTSQTKVFVNRKFIHQSGDLANNTAPSSNTPAKKPTAPVNSKKEKTTPKDPLDKLLPPPANNTSKAAPPSAPSKRKSPNQAIPSEPPASKRKVELDLDLRNRDQDLRHAPKVIKPTSVIGSHAFSSPPRITAVATPPAPTIISNPIAPAQILPPAIKPAIITNDTVKLDIPQNNRIFVDGKAYEVMFIDEVAVIERAGNPHRVYFAGPPRNVIVDGVPHLLAFGETRNIEIEGSLHPIRFGAPSRELYIGGHPFKGQFGGSPIFATINGKKHEIRLGGSAPEVRIDPDPAYDLARFLNKMREEKKVEIKAAQPKLDDPFMLLKKLQKSGYLKPVTVPVSAPSVAAPLKLPESTPRMPFSASAPVLASPTLVDKVGIERRAVPPSLKDFNIRLLKIRYDSVVKAIINKRADSCPYCGMRLDGMSQKSEGWTAHMDWHVKRNLSKQEKNQYRKWYPSASVWLTSKANEEENNKDKDEEQQPTTVAGVVSKGQKECAVCREKFDEYFDQDEEMWRLRDTVEVSGKIVHVACSTDASLIDQPETPSVKQEPLDFEDVKPIINSSSSSHFDRKPQFDTKHQLVGI
ncbi:unnamed protein product [Caenorhabditis bovis]|uniref:CID domain-containing protein n=1 Tax=Caenorhabditis bovis TaxID=2654633 RepID=A0A8S1ERQ3_9PELO|nr:unnamed protein product [Caenorhabditis bovis]